MPPASRFPLRLLNGRFAVCRLAPSAPWPKWALDAKGPLVSLTRTSRETSAVVNELLVPEGIQAERGWRAFEVVGPIPFSTTGVVSGLTMPLAAAGVGVFVVSTFDTDYVLVKDASLARAVAALQAEGFDVRGVPSGPASGPAADVPV